jgi:hypothetical protein
LINTSPSNQAANNCIGFVTFSGLKLFVLIFLKLNTTFSI